MALLRKSGRTVPALLTHHGLESCRYSVTPDHPVQTRAAFAILRILLKGLRITH